jgi:hypothetical protein
MGEWYVLPCWLLYMPGFPSVPKTFFFLLFPKDYHF